MVRPRIIIKREPIDLSIEIVGFLTFLLLIAIPFYYFNELPDMIPSHYGATGQPDDFSNKNIIWVLPLIGTILFIGLHWLNKHPHRFNYPQKITAENAEQQYKNATRLIRILNTLITSVFAYISFSSIQIALGKQQDLGTYFTPLFLTLTFSLVAYFLWKSMKKNTAGPF